MNPTEQKSTPQSPTATDQRPAEAPTDQGQEEAALRDVAPPEPPPPFGVIDPCDPQPAPLPDLQLDPFMPTVDTGRIQAAQRLVEVTGVGDGLHVFDAVDHLLGRWTAGEFQFADEQFHNDLYCAYRSRPTEVTAADWAVTKASVFGLDDPALPAGTPRNVTFAPAFNDLVTALVEYDSGRHEDADGAGGYGVVRSQQARRIAAGEAALRLRLELQQSVTDFTVRLADEMRRRVDNDLALLNNSALTKRLSDTGGLWGVVNSLVPGGVRSSDFGRQVALLGAEVSLFDWLATDQGNTDVGDVFKKAVTAAVKIDSLWREVSAGTQASLNGTSQQAAGSATVYQMAAHGATRTAVG